MKDMDDSNSTIEKEEYRIVEKKLKGGNSIFHAEYKWYLREIPGVGLSKEGHWSTIGIENCKTIEEAKKQIEIYENSKIVEVFYHDVK